MTWLTRPHGTIQGKKVSDDLDLMRGFAAVAVLLYHIRYRFFFDYADVAHSDWFVNLFYMVTSFGHDAVIIFFVLSGYFISSSVLRDQQLGRWSWPRYAINRLTRLYFVLLPGIALTFFWDHLGLSFFAENPVYSAPLRPWINDFFPVVDRLSVSVALANATFLQIILAPPFGSNAALWSLSYEFWYYVLFPLGWFALVRPPSLWRAVLGLGAVGLLLVFVGRPIATYFPIWLLGAGVSMLPQLPFLQRHYAALTTSVAMGCFCMAVAMTHFAPVKHFLHNSVPMIDTLTAILFAMLLYFLLHNQTTSRNGWYTSVARVLAGCSYTLYLVHLPLVVFLRAAFVPDTPWSPTPFYCGLSVVIAFGCLGYAYLIARLTEAQTPRIREYFLRRFCPSKPAVVR